MLIQERQFLNMEMYESNDGCEECSVTQLYNQQNMAGVEAGGHARCFPGTSNEAAALQIQGSFGDEEYRFAEVTSIYILYWTEACVCGQINLVNLDRRSAHNSSTGRASVLYRSRAAAQMWQSRYFTFSPSLKQTWEVMLQKQTSISYGVDGLPPGVSLDSRSEERSGLEFAANYLRLGEINSEEQITASFILRSTDLEMTNTYRYFMTVPGVLTTMGGTLTAVLYVTLAPLAVLVEKMPWRIHTRYGE